MLTPGGTTTDMTTAITTSMGIMITLMTTITVMPITIRITVIITHRGRRATTSSMRGSLPVRFRGGR